jgi:hypothetical protein
MFQILGPSPGITCKRAPGDLCQNIPAFDDSFVNGFKEKGFTHQEDLIDKQIAQTLRDVDDPRRDVASQDNFILGYNYVPMDEDERRWLESGDFDVPGFQPETQDTCTESITRCRPEDIPPGKFDTNISETPSNPNEEVMVIKDSRGKDHDFLPGKPGSTKPSWSDMAMHDWRSACTSGQEPVLPNSLRYVIQHNLEAGGSTTDTRKVTDAATQK